MLFGHHQERDELTQFYAVTGALPAGFHAENRGSIREGYGILMVVAQKLGSNFSEG